MNEKKRKESNNNVGEKKKKKKKKECFNTHKHTRTHKRNQYTKNVIIIYNIHANCFIFKAKLIVL